MKGERSFWHSLLRRFEWSVLPPQWLAEQWRCSDIGVFAVRRRTRVREEAEGGPNVGLGSFFASYPHDQRYVTREEEEAERKRAEKPSPAPRQPGR